MTTDKSSRRVWPLPVAVVVGLITFAATFYWYAEAHRTHQPGSAIPITIGIATFAVAMMWLTWLLVPEDRKNAALVVFGVTIVETAVFAYLLMFLLLNIYGS
jgi:hypothetical protein